MKVQVVSISKVTDEEEIKKFHNEKQQKRIPKTEDGIPITANRFKDEWIRAVMSKLSLSNDKYQELSKIYDDNYVERNLVIHNNVANQRKSLSAIEAYYKLPEVSVLNENGILFVKSDIKKSVPAMVVDDGVNNRQVIKKEMRRAEQDPERILEVPSLDRMQNNFKKLINADYGLGGYPGSPFYNKFLADTITTAGRNITACASMVIETLGRGFRNYVLDAQVSLIEFTTKQDCKMLNEKYGLRNKTVDEVLRHMLDYHYNGYYAKTFLTHRLEKLSQEELNVLYAKNNIEEFFSLPIIKERVSRVLNKITKETPLLDHNKDNYTDANGNKIFPYKDDMNFVISSAKELVSGFTHFAGDYDNGHYNPTMVEQIANKKRRMVLGMDTDSTNSTFYNMYKSFREEYKNDLDNNKDILIASLVIILAQTVVGIIKETLWRYTEALGVEESLRPKIDLEIEHIMKQILLNPLSKKQYAYQSLVTDFYLLKKKKVKITGLVFIKGTTNPIVKDRITDILIEDIMRDLRELNYHEIMRKIKKETEEQKKLLGDVSYIRDHKTILKVKKEDVALSDYRLKAVLLWNTLYSDLEVIELPGSFGIIKLDIDQSLLDVMKKKFPTDYKGFKEFAIIIRKFKLCNKVIRHGIKLKVDQYDYTSKLTNQIPDASVRNRFIKFLTVVNNTKEYSLQNYNENLYFDILTFYEEAEESSKKDLRRLLDLDLNFDDDKYMDKLIMETCDRMALPQNIAKIPDILLYNDMQIMDRTQASQFEHLISPLVNGLGMICPRNDKGDICVSSVLAAY